MTAVEVPARITNDQARQMLADAATARDEGMAQAEDADTSGWYSALLDQAIGWFAQTGLPFSANDIRDLLPPDFPARGLMGARFGAASTAGVIELVGDHPSRKKNTHLKPIGVWIGSAHADAYFDRASA